MLQRIRHWLPRALVDQPFQYLITWVFFISGINLLFGFGENRPLTQNGGPAVMYGWIAMALISNPMILWGMHRASTATKAGKLLNAWRIERLGLIPQGTATLVIGVLIVAVRGPEAILSSVMYVMLFLAYAFRYIILLAKERDLRGLADPPLRGD